MELTHVRLLVDDFAACFRFYRDVMGLAAQFGDESDTYAEFRAGDVVLGLFGRTEMAEAVGFDPLAAGDRVALCFAVENVDEALGELRERGAVVVGEPQDRPLWGLRVAHVRDPDGNLLELNHQIPMAE